MLRLKTSDFRPAFKDQVNFDHPTQPNKFNPCTEIKSNLIPHTEIKSISTTYTKTQKISMLILKTSDSRPGYK